MDSTYDASGAAALGAGTLLIYALIFLITAFVYSLTFAKAGEPRWAAFVPVYNLYVHTKIAGYNPVLFLLYLVPVANIVFAILVAVRIARGYGRSDAFGVVGLFIFAIVGYLMVGLGSDRYDQARAAA
ncbi:MAG: DUF5684 domain-containing protein [Beutenbergiaceae bacterium]